MEIGRIIRALSEKRPFFFSESDFKHALAWEINKQYQNCAVRLEYPALSSGHVDIWINLNGHVFALELKYLTRKIIVKEHDLILTLKEHGAQDQRRYDFWKDVSRLEAITEKIPDSAGYAIVVTNDSNYWNTSRKTTMDADYVMNEGRIVKGKTLLWGPNTTAGTMKGRESKIPIKGSYECHWENYSEIEGQPSGKFRYLCLEVRRG